MLYADDFQEIEHCGGLVTIRIECTQDGRQRHSTSIRSQRSGPAAWVGIYALLPGGDAVLDFKMGGIGQPWEPQPPRDCVPVILGSDSESRWGHKCPRCGGYFRSGSHPAVYPLTCPYCGLLANAVNFLSDAQRSYVHHYVETLLDGLEEVTEPGTSLEIPIDLDAIADMGSETETPDFYRREQNQQTQFDCPECGEFNDIRGRLGYCSSCGKRNNLQQLNLVIEELRESLNTGGCTAEHAVSRSVSKFDAVCRDFITQLCSRVRMKPSRRAQLERIVFHNLNDSICDQLKFGFDINLFRGVEDKRAYFQKMMERRHIFEHNDGVADARYIEQSGERDIVEGQLIRESQANAHDFLSLLTRICRNFDNDFHEIFPLTEWPIDYAAGRI